ncbi:MAG: MBL fold metallo-hydrolase [Spirochaetae bacterium HGW-Spirochaetae-7]|jgi:glyoxylase-like metal-dependent hydrolase (beta-lactamase superfamily II)|nr:MAG: MBL fold metallo-hydrolase [Spirochaetae bacterium HGW-Spirochaetae-7]
MIRTLSVGPIQENVYIVEAEGQALLVVDPGAEAERLIEEILASAERSHAPMVLVAMTHGHLDHVAALAGVLAGLAARGLVARTFAPEGDRDYFGDRAKATNERIFKGIRAMAFFDQYWTPVPEADEYFGHGFILPGTDAVVLHTPGHTPGSSCFLVEGGSSLLTGDTLFRDGRGRTDGFDGDEGALLHSIQERLCVLPDHVQLWPGHGAQTTIGREKRLYY